MSDPQGIPQPLLLPRWRVRDLSGKYSFSNDVIFNENLAARLGVPRPLLPAASDVSSPTSSLLRHVRERPRIRTAIGRSYDDLLAIKRARNEERQRLRSYKVVSAVDGGASDVAGVS